MLILTSLFVAGLILLLWSSQTLVHTTVALSHRLGISPLITGITLVAIGTSLPELVVSTFAVAVHDTNLAMGNIVGSNVVNVLLVLGIGSLVGKLRIGTQKTVKTALFLAATTGVFIGSQYILAPPWSGIVLIGMAVMFTLYQLREGQHEHFLSLQLRKLKRRKKIQLSDWLWCGIAIAGLTSGGTLVIFATEQISHLVGISTTFLGLSITALATSLPELFTTVLSEKEHQEKLALGNILGSNVYNLLFIGGTLLLFEHQPLVNLEILALVLSTGFLVLIILIFKGKPFPKSAAIIGLIGYILYLITSYVGLG